MARKKSPKTKKRPAKRPRNTIQVGDWVFVEWEDAYHSGRWRDPKDALVDWGDIPCRTVGMVTHLPTKQSPRLRLVMQVSLNSYTNQPDKMFCNEVSSIQTIPQSTVRGITKLPISRVVFAED